MDAQTIFLLAIAGGLLLICALITAGLLIKRTISVTVAGFSWYRKIILEHYIWVEESSYSGFPAGSRNQRKRRESYQSYEFLRTETRTTTVNGQTTTTSNPVYGFVTRWRTKYSYEIQRWRDSRIVVAEDQTRTNVHWPSYTLDASTQEREKNRKEQYLVYFQTAKGKQYKRKMQESAWRDLDAEVPYILRVNLFGQIKRVEFSSEQQVQQIMQR